MPGAADIGRRTEKMISGAGLDQVRPRRRYGAEAWES